MNERPRPTLLERTFWRHYYRQYLPSRPFGAPNPPRRAAEIAAYYELNRGYEHPRDAAYQALLDYANERRLAEDFDEVEEDALAWELLHFHYAYEVPERWRDAAERSAARFEEWKRAGEEARAALAGVNRDEAADRESIRDRQPPEEARRVWRGLGEDFEAARAIAHRAGVDVGAAAYWAILFAHAGVGVWIGQAYGAGGTFRRSPLAREKNPDLVAALDNDE